MSAVSNRLMPSSSALCTTARVCSASHRMPKLLHPSPTAETLSPELPSLRYSTIAPFGVRLQHPANGGRLRLFDSVAPAFAPQRRDVDAERFGGFFERGAGGEHARDVPALDFIEAGSVGDAGERLGRIVKQR